MQLATVDLLASFILLLPMFWNQPAAKPQSGKSDTSAASQGSLQGLSTFLTRWEMNDLLFMIVEENIRPAAQVPEQPALWFVVVPDHLRQVITKQLAIWSGQPEERIPFMATRVITAMFFSAVMCWLALRAWREPHQLPPVDFPRFGLVLVSSTDAKSLVLVLGFGVCAVREITLVAGSFGAELDLLFAILVSLPRTESGSPRQ